MSGNGRQPLMQTFGAVAPAPSHLTLARDQLFALLTGVAIPHCGTRSPARLLPAPVLVEEIGAKLVMHVERRVVIRGMCRPRSADSEVYTKIVVFAAISLTYGVVKMWSWSSNEELSNVRFLETAGICWVGNGCAVVQGSSDYALAIANLRTNEVMDVAETPGFSVASGFHCSNCRKWMVLYNNEKSIVILLLSGLNNSEGEDGDCVNHQEISRVVETERTVMWVDMIGENVAALVTIECCDVEVWCIDLEVSFVSEKLAVTGKFQGFPTMEEKMVFHSKKHKVIVATQQLNQRGCQWRLMSLQLPKVLHQSGNPLYKVDHTHFAEHDKSRGTLSVFSTDDFDNPVRVFLLHGEFRLGNGFIVFWEEGYIDLVDTVTGAWLLCQPSSRLLQFLLINKS
ncbi:hypothetical protein Pelo_15647 [Pelomyxa schiedti]|nr:hypothetical protein Pelo_15647 [Pelomyxa schiedti]